jgi:hypothetical protein
VLLATESGRVLDVQLNEADTTAHVVEVNLRDNVEVWRLLRNGCVVGHADVLGAPQPLINLASFARVVPPVAAGCGPATAQGSPATPASRNHGAAGTWDFKWPAGKQLKVIVRPPGGASQPTAGALAAVELVKSLAQSWLVGTSLSIRFVDDAYVDYDILVDLNPLPRILAGGRARADQKISYPLSDLGSYAGRRRFGEPTLYVGCAEGLKDEDGTPFDPDADDYFKADIFKNMVLHEFGHAFGLPHLHQHPSWTQKQIFLPSAKIAEVVRQELGVVLDDEFINEHFLLPWPGDASTYSEWPNLTELDPVKISDQSVMMGLPVRAVLRGQAGARTTFAVKVGPLDRAWIQQLYPAKPAESQASHKNR